MLYVPDEDTLAFSAFTYFLTQATEVETTQGSEIPFMRLAEEIFPALSTI